MRYEEERGRVAGCASRFGDAFHALAAWESIK